MSTPQPEINLRPLQRPLEEACLARADVRAQVVPQDCRLQPESMPDTNKDRLAEIIIARHCDFELALTEKRRRYPKDEFQSFAAAVRRYIESSKGDKLIHRSVVHAVHGLTENLRTGAKVVPGDILIEAERVECLLFLGYDPYSAVMSLRVCDYLPCCWPGLASMKAWRLPTRHRWPRAVAPR